MDNVDPKTYFWPYDLFGYLLPGFIATAPWIAFQQDVRDVFAEHFQDQSWVDVVGLIVIIYIAGHLVSALSSCLLERILIAKTFGYPTAQLFSPPGRRVSRLLRILPGFCDSYPREFQYRVRELFEERFKLQYHDWERDRVPQDVYWTIWTYISEQLPAAYRTGMHWVELYGFSRNACMSFLLIAFVPLCPQWTFCDCNPVQFLVYKYLWIGFCLFASAVLYWNYAKLFRRQNDYVFRAFVASAAPPRRAT